MAQGAMTQEERVTTDATFDWRQARHPLVRELGWSLFSEPIVDHLPGITDGRWLCDEDRGAREILATLEKNPRPLVKHLEASRDQRLGARFEAHWAYFLANHPRYELLARNWPVRHGKRTLGALDFLFRDLHSGAIVHGEVAVKFYLAVVNPPSLPLVQWLGPNPDDSLQLKLEHLSRHQLPLSNNEEARRQLREAGLPVADVRAVMVKGYLFHPLGSLIETASPINPRHLRGEWLWHAQLPALLGHHPGSCWVLAPRQQWLMPIPRHHDRAMLRDRVSQLLATTGQPLMLCQFDEGSEPRRYFVVPEGWPM